MNQDTETQVGTILPTPTHLHVAPQDFIVGLERGLRVIEAFDDENPRLTVAQVSRRARLPRSAARRHLMTLTQLGYAQTDGKQYWLAPRVLRLGQSYLSSARLPRLALPFAQRVSQVTGETASISVLDGHEVVYVARGTPPRFITVGYPIGARVPAHVVTPGPVILATWSDVAVAQWIETHDFTSFTVRTVTDHAAFRAEVEQARDQGFWATVGQYDPAFAGIAIALVDRKGRCHGAISMTVLSSQYSPERMQHDLLPHLREAAQALQPALSMA